MLTDKEIEEIIDYVAGSCTMGGVYSAASSVVERELTTKEEEQLENALIGAEMSECTQCGWWSHPGECLGPVCDECAEENDNDE